MSELIFFEPVHKPMIWGTEDWVISAHEKGDCVIKNGEFEGRFLSDIWRDEPEVFGGFESDRFPLLLKIIDAKEDLSIQVHPDDRYAGIHENGSLGKTECWYILEACDGATLVIGHNAKSRNELCKLIDNHDFKYLIKEVPVKEGDFVQIPPGTVHAIKGGVKILETQQNSDITYRVYDYDRKQNGKLRDLHVEHSKAVINIPGDTVKVMSTETAKGIYELVSCDRYKVYKAVVSETLTFTVDGPFALASVIKGAGYVNGLNIREGAHFLVPADTKELVFSGSMTLILSTPV